jgi:CDP-glycerol glycerophosphotransferase (TagB/SpsB family)
MFTTHGQLMHEKNDNQIYVNLWHGIGPKKAGFLLAEEKMAPQDKEFYFQMKNRTDYIIVPTMFWQLIFSSLFKTDTNVSVFLKYT